VRATAAVLLSQERVLIIRTRGLRLHLKAIKCNGMLYASGSIGLNPKVCVRRRSCFDLRYS
jgi:hypothetical protein